MENISLKFVFDRKKKATKTVRGLVQLEVAHNRKRKYISTGVKVYADQWNSRRMVINSIDSLMLNDKLNALTTKVREWVIDLEKRGESFAFDKLERFLDSDFPRAISFIGYASSKIESRNDIRESTKRCHRKLIKSLEEFGKIVYFDELTRRNITEYDNWLHGRGYEQATVHSYHKLMKIYINLAIGEGVIVDNPYAGMKINRGKTGTRKYLAPGELKQIESAEIPHGAMEKIRDLFVFQCYTGLAYADMMNFDFTKVVKRDGRYVMVDTRQKCNENYYIVLLSPAVKVLEKYDFKLPRISCQQYNLRLKVIADYARLDRNLTSHMGRHTFAVLAINSGIRIEAVSKMLGHADIATTQIYAKLLNKEVEEAFETLENKLGKGTKRQNKPI